MSEGWILSVRGWILSVRVVDTKCQRGGYYSSVRGVDTTQVSEGWILSVRGVDTKYQRGGY